MALLDESDLSGIAERLTLEGRRHGSTHAADLLIEIAEPIALQLQSDARRRGLFGLWGLSLNMDELAQQAIVSPEVISAIGVLSSRTLSKETPHAGLQHTYGYLLSVIETPYGLKRTRWLSNEIEAGLGLDSDILEICPSDGTLLTNATWIAGQFALRGHRHLLWLQRCLSRHVHRELREFDWRKLPLRRFREHFTFRSRNGRQCELTLRTDIVTYPQDSSRHLLVYSVDDSRRPSPQLITMFSIGDAVIDELHDRAGTRTDIRTRYNAFVPAVSGFEFEGTCGFELQN